MFDRRTVIAASLGAMAMPAAARSRLRKSANPAFPAAFLWGAATAPHQTEGNNTNSDLWYIENQKPTAFAERSGDAANSFELWPLDLDLAKGIGLNTYRFGIEWARIEPDKGFFSRAMIDHYGRMIDGCHERGLTPIVTFNHFTAPRWFSAQGGWTNPESAELFARFCATVARAVGDRMSYAITLNEPNILTLLKRVVPPQVWEIQKLTVETAARRLNVPKFVCANVAGLEDLPALEAGLAAGHRAGRAAIKAERPQLPVGLSIAMMDDQAAGPGSIRDLVRKEQYGPWLELAQADDFLGVQNYERVVWGAQGKLPPSPQAVRNWSGSEVWAPSLAGAVRHAYSVARVPILVSEHGVGSDDDTIRANLIPPALAHLKRAMDDGVPVIGYCHWSLIDNFEWIFGYKPKFGLASVDPRTFARTPKPSAAVLGRIARANALQTNDMEQGEVS